MIKIVTILLFLISTTFAQGYEYYMGIHSGVFLSSAAYESNSEKTNESGINFGSIGFSIAYEFTINEKYFWGVDWFETWSFNDSKDNSQLAGLTVNSEIKHSRGFTIKVGHKIDGMKAFARIGFLDSSFEFSTQNAAALSSGVKKTDVWGGLLGIGLDIPLSERAFWGISYDLAVYQNQSTNNILIQNGIVNTEVNLKSQVHFFNLALKFRF